MQSFISADIQTQWKWYMKINKERFWGSPRGILGISSDGDDRRILLGLKFSIPGFFGVRKFGLGSLIWVGIFWGYLKKSDEGKDIVRWYDE